MDRKRTSHGFTDVDSNHDPEAWIRVLDRMHEEPFYACYKKRAIEMLDPQHGGIYLDIGAGTGHDARALRDARNCSVVALDRSLTMMQESNRRGLTTSAVGMAEQLPFADNRFDGCWSDRTFQHLTDPKNALAESVRVTKPGGRVVTVDPDYSTQMMEFPDQRLAKTVFRFRAEYGLRNGTMAHTMATMFAEQDLSAVEVETMTLEVRDPTAVDNVMGLRTWAESARSVGLLTEDDVKRWELLYDEIVKAGRFMYAVTFYLTIGVVLE
jgi:ubiquinone/menaquinone biosynthesis C-methylase UbiE